jgi:hypothetical protein
MNRMNRIASLVSSLAVAFLAAAMALSFCNAHTGEAQRVRALRPAPSSWSPLSPPPWKDDCATDNECIA